MHQGLPGFSPKLFPGGGVVYAVSYIQMRLVWDESKSRSSENMALVSIRPHWFFWIPCTSAVKNRVVEAEERWQTIGMVNGVLLVLVAYTVVDEKQEVLRISTQVTRQERTEYEETNQI
jgi:uncharacterized protein